MIRLYQVFQVDEVGIGAEEGFGRLFGLGAGAGRRQHGVHGGQGEGRRRRAVGAERGGVAGRRRARRQQVEAVHVGRRRRPGIVGRRRRARRRLRAPRIAHWNEQQQQQSGILL